MKPLENRWALVTGASRGIGSHIARGLAEQGCGLILHSRHRESLQGLLRELEKTGVPVLSVEQDFDEAGAAGKLLEKVQALHVCPDILVNNAGINVSIDRQLADPGADLTALSEEDCERTMRINVTIPLVLANALIPAMRKKGYGRILFLTSSIHGSAEHLAYSVSKGALDKAIRDLSEAYGKDGIGVSGIDPGWCRTYLGGEGADMEPAGVLPGALIPICGDLSFGGRILAVQQYRKMNLADAVRAAKESLERD